VPQIVIDPRDRGHGPTETVSINVLPATTRDYGFVPDLRVCKAGDLILFFSLKSSLKSRLIDTAIVRTQIASGFGEEDARWTHVAVFLYQDFIVEADPWKGVITRSLYADIPDSALRIRRKPGLSEEQRYKIALCAQQMLGSRYSHTDAISLAVRAISSGVSDRPWKPILSNVVICSKVFYDAYAQITLSLLKDCPISDLVMPAHLSATSDLEDVQVPWLSVT
jgi:hypothetical protein